MSNAAAAAAAAAVPQPPAAVRVAADPAVTTITRVVAAGGALEADEWTLPERSPCVEALPYLDWSAPVNGRVRVAATELQGVCLLACSFDLANPNVLGGLRRSNLIETSIGHVPCAAILHELHCGLVLDTIHQSERALFQAIQDSPLLDKNRLSFQAAWLVDATDPFDLPAVAAIAGSRARAAAPAVPAQPGPDELKFLHLTSWAAILQESNRHLVGQEARAIARIVILLSHRERDATRREPASNIRAIAATLATYVSTWACLGQRAAPAQLARHLPALLVSGMAVLPHELAGPCGTALGCESELRDAYTLLRGRESEAASVMWARIHNNLDGFPVLSEFKGRLPSSGATKDVLERLMIGMQLPSGSPLVRTAELSRELERRGKGQTVKDLMSGGSTVTQVVEELLDSHTTTAGAATVPDSGQTHADTGVSAAAVTGTGPMEQREFERAITAPNFVEAYETMKGASRLDVIDAAGSSGSILMLRYLFYAPPWMRPRHAAFDIMGMCIADRNDYLAYCVTVNVDDEEVPSHLATYRLTEAQNDMFWACKWSEIDMVNSSPTAPHEGGFLAVRYLQNGTVYSQVAASDFYMLESSLLGIRDWFGRLLIGVGFSASPGDGHSWSDVVDRQLELSRYVGGLPASERPLWHQWAVDNFKTHALGRAQTLFKARLITSRPADEALSFFLPDEAAFFANITAKFNDAQPMAVVRRAFPTYFPSEPVVLPGAAVATAPRATSSGAGPSGAGAGEGKRKPTNSKGGGKGRVDTPGSKSDLSKVLGSGHLFLASRVCDIKAVAASLKVKVEDHCWPVLFSNKQGDAALALCPHPDVHGGMQSKWHKPPRGFDQSALNKKFWSAASADQKREAGWQTQKKAKI